MAAKRASKTAKSKRVFGQRTGAGENVSGRAVCAGVHARPADPAVADARHAGVCGEARLDDRGSDQRGWFRCGRTRTPGETARCSASARDRCRAGLAAGPLGPVTRRSGRHVKRTGGTGRRFRVAHRSAGSDNADGPRHGRVALRVCRVRTRNPPRTYSRGHCRSAAARESISAGP